VLGAALMPDQAREDAEVAEIERIVRQLRDHACTGCQADADCLLAMLPDLRKRLASLLVAGKVRPELLNRRIDI
jgi:hypothetical protein